MASSGVSKGGLRVLEHPPQLWNNSQISSSVATIYADNRQLVARTNNKLTIRSLNNSFLSILGQNSLLCQPAIYLQERVSEGRGQRFGGGARDWLSTSLLQLLDTPLASPQISFILVEELLLINFHYHYQEVERKHEAMLQMYGEKAEEAEELKLDIDDLKTMYRQQVRN